MSKYDHIYAETRTDKIKEVMQYDWYPLDGHPIRLTSDDGRVRFTHPTRSEASLLAMAVKTVEDIRAVVAPRHFPVYVETVEGRLLEIADRLRTRATVDDFVPLDARVDPSPPLPLVEGGWVYPGEVGMIYGLQGSGKSWVSLWQAGQIDDAFYVSLEGRPDIRVSGSQHLRDRARDGQLEVWMGKAPLFNPQGGLTPAGTRVFAHAIDTGKRYLVIDTWEKASAGLDSSSDTVAARVVNLLDGVREMMGDESAITLVYHSTKSDGSTVAGSRIYGDAFDSMSRVSRNHSVVTYVSHKRKEAAASVAKRFRVVADPATSLAELIEESRPAAELEALTDLDLDAAAEEVRAHEQTQDLASKTVKDQILALLPCTSEHLYSTLTVQPNAVRAKLSKLMAAGLVTKTNEVWNHKDENHV